MIVRGAVDGPVDGGAAEVEVQVVLPGDADAAVELHAVLDHLGGVGPDPRLGRAHEVAGVRLPGRHGSGGGGGDAVARLDHDLVVGDAVLEGLVGGQGPPERVAVAQVVEGEAEDLVEDAGGLGALQHARHPERVLDVIVRAAYCADDRVGGHGDVGEDEARAALDRTVVITLNGGLGTSMGLAGPKSLLPVHDDLTFLDITIRQVLALREQLGVRLPLLFMNSFSTQQATGEVLARYYTVLSDAEAHFCNVLSSLWEKRFNEPPEVKDAWREAAGAMARASCAAFRDLLSDPDFLTYFEQVTPKEVELEKQRPDSAPNAESPRDAPPSGSVAALAAVPWVFRWIQSRQMVPAWYGLGSGIETYLSQNEDREQALGLVREMFEHWPFFRSLVSNSEIALRHTDLNIANYYVEVLADPRAAAERILGRIREEYERTLTVLRAVTQEPLLGRAEDRVLEQSISLKEPYLDPLNYIQVRLLRDYRARLKAQAPTEELDMYERAILASVEGIATGLGTTG